MRLTLAAGRRQRAMTWRRNPSETAIVAPVIRLMIGMERLPIWLSGWPSEWK